MLKTLLISLVMLHIELTGAATTIEAPDGRIPGRLSPGLPNDPDNWLLGSWKDNVVSNDCNQPVLKVYMMAWVDGRDANDYIAGLTTTLGLGANFIRKFVIDDSTIEITFWVRPPGAYNTPYGNPARFSRIDDRHINLLLPTGEKYPLTRCSSPS